MFHIILHPAGVRLVEMRAEVAVVETSVTDLADGLTLVLVIIAEQTILEE